MNPKSHIVPENGRHLKYQTDKFEEDQSGFNTIFSLAD